MAKYKVVLEVDGLSERMESAVDEIADIVCSSHFPFYKCMTGIEFISFDHGDTLNCYEISERLGSGFKNIEKLEDGSFSVPGEEPFFIERIGEWDGDDITLENGMLLTQFKDASLYDADKNLWCVVYESEYQYDKNHGTFLIHWREPLGLVKYKYRYEMHDLFDSNSCSKRRETVAAMVREKSRIQHIFREPYGSYDDRGGK